MYINFLSDYVSTKLRACQGKRAVFVAPLKKSVVFFDVFRPKTTNSAINKKQTPFIAEFAVFSLVKSLRFRARLVKVVFAADAVNLVGRDVQKLAKLQNLLVVELEHAVLETAVLLLSHQQLLRDRALRQALAPARRLDILSYRSCNFHTLNV